LIEFFRAAREVRDESGSGSQRGKSANFALQSVEAFPQDIGLVFQSIQKRINGLQRLRIRLNDILCNEFSESHGDLPFRPFDCV
jgi:hypothetical protein